MYQYTKFDRQFVKARASQYRDQLTRWQAGQLPEDEFRPLRLQNGWYVQRYAPMLRVAMPYGEIMSQWSTLHPEFSCVPRKFKIAISGAKEDRAAIGWHDVGLQLLRNTEGELGFQVLVGGGMGRTPIIGTVIPEFLPWNQIMN